MANLSFDIRILDIYEALSLEIVIICSLMLFVLVLDMQQLRFNAYGANAYQETKQIF